MKDHPATLQLNPKEIFPFELDDFQKQAIAALNAGKSVVVCAPTGSGKTLVGEYAIYRAMSRGKRVFYTTPLKALSNQKFRDFQQRFGSEQVGQNVKEVGLITGDILINPEAPIVVMTTEIFRNMLYETPIGQVGTSVKDVEAVILDECHYISNKGRGTVWEESIIYCPPEIQIVALSATIGNPQELTDWIERVREKANVDKKKKYTCELVNSDYRPVPLKFHFINKKGLFPLLNAKQDKVNPRLKLKSNNRGSRRRLNREDCPEIADAIAAMQEKEMLPCIYVIFSRRGCDRAVEDLTSLVLVSREEGKKLQAILLEFFLANNYELQKILVEYFAEKEPELQQKLVSYAARNEGALDELIEFFARNLKIKTEFFQVLGQNSNFARGQQLEPLTRGIAAHHAGVLPAWKELVEKLFELGLIKLIFATATLSAGINMPARTTVISSLSKRSDEGHRLLTPSEFLQIAGRAGRRGKDIIGHVVTLQTPFEGAKEAAYLATTGAEALRSWFTPSYGMVLNLLQKHTIEEAKNLLERSFAEYLAQLKLEPEQEAIASITTELAKIDIELAAIDTAHFASFEKLRERLREEYRLLEILQKQAESNRKQKIAPLIPKIEPGRIVFLKGKHVKITPPLAAVTIAKIPGAGRSPDLICLGKDNRYYIASSNDVSDITNEFIPEAEIAKIVLPSLQGKIQLGRWRKGNEITAEIGDLIAKQTNTFQQIAPEVIEQQLVVDKVQAQLDNHPLQQYKSPGSLIKRHKQRVILRGKLHKSQVKYQKHKSYSSYYWEEFLNLIEVLREFEAISGFTPTALGEAAATIRGENELWLGLALMSGSFDDLAPHHLAAAIGALIIETPRSDSWCNYEPSIEVLQALGIKKPANEAREVAIANLSETRRKLNQIQNRYDVAMPVWLERKLIGSIEQWALGVEWGELCENTSLDEGDILRMIRRTVDILWQIPQVQQLPENLQSNARKAIAQMKRFPV
ncbi:MAG: DEAD/DEAH box helicase [Prochloraceae cyanobacterium]|nr:DEAD/DEAH box helicase [Prochloraceae cyanobacterium]